jgi:hypothetical protein
MRWAWEFTACFEMLIRTSKKIRVLLRDHEKIKCSTAREWVRKGKQKTEKYLIVVRRCDMKNDGKNKK